MGATILMAVAFVSCGGSKRQYVYTGAPDPITVAPTSNEKVQIALTGNDHVRISEGEFKHSMGWLARDVYAGDSPQDFAGKTLGRAHGTT
ncbi:MAG TPA: hypothetical protein VK447_01385 [Myxococcaceae bacterium]|nr:hypothetical protein [Myxococcaceae bacterium]